MGLKQQEVLLNISFLEQQTVRLGIKRWWMAEQLGVNKRTVQRWYNGQVKRIKFENLEALAAILECEPTDLMIADENYAYATFEERRHANELIEKENLYHELKARGKWELFEYIVKAVIQPDTPKYLLGKFYNLLADAAMWQEHSDNFRKYAEIALNIGHELDSHSIQVRAYANLLNYWGRRGDIKKAEELLKECESRFSYLDSDNEKAIVYGNMGIAYLIVESFDKCIEYSNKSMELHKKEGSIEGEAFKISVVGMALFYKKDYRQSQEKFEEAIVRGRQGISQDMIAISYIYLASIFAFQGQIQEAEEAYENGLELMKIYRAEEHYQCLVHGKNIALAKKDFKRAKELVEKCIEKSKLKQAPVFWADAYMQALEVAMATGDGVAVKKYQKLAIQAFKDAKMDWKIKEIQQLKI